MKIKAKVYGIFEATIVGFVHNTDKVEAVYVDRDGKVHRCCIEDVKIIDTDYIPTGNFI